MLAALRLPDPTIVFSNGLRSVDQLARRAVTVKWFENAGQKMLPQTLEDARSLWRARGLDDTRVSSIAGWRAAWQIANGAEAVEMRERHDADARFLRKIAHQRHIPDLLDAVIAETRSLIIDASSGDAASATASVALRDGQIGRLAGLEAGRAFNLAALAIAAGQPDHASLLRLRLFAAGHWPLTSCGWLCIL